MIVGMYKLPTLRFADLSQSVYYTNTMATTFGIAGRRLELPPSLCFYKIIVTHGDYILEYVVATTQLFNIYTGEVEEQYTGRRHRDISRVHLAPISLKLIGNPDCHNYLFVSPISYILDNCGSPEYLNLSNNIEFSNPPTQLTDGTYRPMTTDDTTGGYSISHLIHKINLARMNNNEEIPHPTYALDLSRLEPSPFGMGNTDNDIKFVLTINDLQLLSQLFYTIHASGTSLNAWLPELDMCSERFRCLHDIMWQEPVFCQFASTPSIVPWGKLTPYIGRNHTLTHLNLAMSGVNNHISVLDTTRLLDASMSEYHVFRIPILIDVVMHSPLAELDITTTVTNTGGSARQFGSNKIHTHITMATNWNGSEAIVQPLLVQRLEYMAQYMATVYDTTKLSIRLFKNFLDEVILEVVRDGLEDIHYIPLWYYNLSSPTVVNHTITSSIMNALVNR